MLRVPLGMTTVLALAAMGAVGLDSGQLSPREIEPISAAAGPPLFTFVSMPDFLNTDIGDTRLRAGRGWEPGDPNSTNASWARALDVILDEVQAESPAAVLVAGDLVEGHWGIDIDRTGIFGPVRTRPQRRAAITNAGNLYYGEWAKRFSDRGLRVLPAIGDHEVGDNPWPAGSFKLAAVPTYKRVWAKKFTRTATGNRFPLRPIGTNFEDTAYSVRIANTLFVTVDVFKPTEDGMRVTVSGGQLSWLDRMLGRARRSGIKHIIVQGHTPVLGPVRNRHSSELTMPDREDSAFWRLLERHDVDLYLAGEMHDMTTRTEGGVVQVVHGALATWGEANYLVGRVYRDRIELRLKKFHGVVTNRKKIWNTDYKRPHRGVRFSRDTETVGRIVIDKSQGDTRLTGRGRLRDGM